MNFFSQDDPLGWLYIDSTVADADTAAITLMEVGKEALVAAKEEEEKRGQEFGGETCLIKFFPYLS